MAGLVADAEAIKADRDRRYAMMKQECDRAMYKNIGIELGKQKILKENARLAEALEAAGRTDDILKSMLDPVYRDKLLEELGISEEIHYAVLANASKDLRESKTHRQQPDGPSLY